MARSADFDLSRALGEKGFTPAARDAAQLAELVARGDEPAATRALPALAGLAEAGRAAIAAALDAAAAGGSGGRHAAGGSGERHAASGERHAARGERRAAGGSGERHAAADDGARARLIAALGLHARAGDAVARARLIALVGDAAVRARRAAIVALGKLGTVADADVADARAALVARWDAADVPADERRALAEALGKLGGDAALARLRELAPAGDAELARRRDRALLMADRSARRDAPSEVRTDVPPPDGAKLRVRLHCKSGLAALLQAELQRDFGGTAVSNAAHDVILDRPLSALFASRLWTDLGIVVARPARTAEEITAAILAPDTLRILRTLTRGPIRWRLSLPQGHQRAIVWRVARDVTAAAPDLTNDPTATTWDILASDGELELRPRRAADPRFAWRTAEIPASSHPTVAAALAFVATARAGDRVWDPFCGAGAELVERALLRGPPPRSLLGTDLDDAALAAARANLDAAGLTALATLARGDARSHDPGEIDLILTNPPLGSRVHVDAKALLVAALPHFARVLAPAGRLVWITPAPRATGPAAQAAGLIRTFDASVDLGGVRGVLERWERLGAPGTRDAR